jgi:cytochrome c biogenesis protein CcmG/thiol:disulfide interchange protein DsbE
MTDEAPVRRSTGFVYFLPLAIFVAFVGIAYSLLSDTSRNPQELASVLIDKPAPEFELPPVAGLETAAGPVPGLSRSDLTGGVTLVNVFASWCGPCRDEHPLLMELAKDDRFKLVGLNYKDDPGNAVSFLNGLGNPYERVGSDRNGRVGIDWGVYGVPETFVVAADGTIVGKHVGPLTPDSITQRLMPAIEKALARSSSG